MVDSSFASRVAVLADAQVCLKELHMRLLLHHRLSVPGRACSCVILEGLAQLTASLMTQWIWNTSV